MDMEMRLYEVCKRMIENGDTQGMEEKLDVFWAAGKLTEEHYNELVTMLHPVEPEPEPTPMTPEVEPAPDQIPAEEPVAP